MGLDWRPLNKPKKGYKAEYEKIFNLLSGKVEQCISLIEKVKGKIRRSFLTGFWTYPYPPIKRSMLPE